MPVPVLFFLAAFSLVLIAFPVACFLSRRSGAPRNTAALSLVPLVTWIVAPAYAAMAGPPPPDRATALVIAALWVIGTGAAVAAARPPGLSAAARRLGWVSAAGLLLCALWSGASAMFLLRP